MLVINVSISNLGFSPNIVHAASTVASSHTKN